MSFSCSEKNAFYFVFNIKLKIAQVISVMLRKNVFGLFILVSKMVTGFVKYIWNQEKGKANVSQIKLL